MWKRMDDVERTLFALLIATMVGGTAGLAALIAMNVK